MTQIPNFEDLRANRQEILEAQAAQRRSATQRAGEIIALLQTVTHAPGYKTWKDALLASADGEHQKALSAATPHAMAIALGAESAYRAAAHAAEDLIEMHQKNIQAMKQAAR